MRIVGEDVERAGVYSVTITKNDANGKCIGNGYASFELNSCLEVEIEEEIIFDGVNEQLNLTVEEGYASYKWEGPEDFEANTASINFTESGTYSVTVTNEFGCSFVDEITIECEYVADNLLSFLCQDAPNTNNNIEFNREDFLSCGGIMFGENGNYPTGPVSNVLIFEHDEKEYSVNISELQEGNINLQNYYVNLAVGDVDVDYSLYFVGANNPNVILLKFESKNLANIFALMDVLSCYNSSQTKAYFINGINSYLSQNEDDCNELDAILSGLHDEFIEEHINDNKKIEYIEKLISCNTCNDIFWGTNEKPIIVKLIRTYSLHF